MAEVLNILSLPTFWCNLITMGGKIGYNAFVLISGYFLVKNSSESLNIKRLLKFWLQVFFYSVVIFAVMCLTGLQKPGILSAIKALLPITFSTWGFASAYFVLYLLHPFLNAFIRAIGKATYQKILIVLVIIWSIIPTFTTLQFYGSTFTWFVTLYLIAGYIRLYGFNPKWTAKTYLLFTLLVCAVSYGLTMGLTVLGTKIPIAAQRATYFYGQEKITMLLASIGLFMFFRSLKMGYSAFINLVASATFGVYLIHDSPLKHWLWEDFLKTSEYIGTNAVIWHCLLCCIMIFVFCAVIDLARKQLLEKPFMKLLQKSNLPLYSKIRDFLLKIFSKVSA